MPRLQRLRAGWSAAVFALAAGISMLVLMQVDTIEFATQRPLYAITAWILMISAIGPLVEQLDIAGHLLLWNGLGWSAGLSLFGLESVGSMPLWPLMLAALALTFWPKSSQGSLPPLAIAIAVIGGFAICWLGWSDIMVSIPTDWLEVDR